MSTFCKLGQLILMKTLQEVISRTLEGRPLKKDDILRFHSAGLHWPHALSGYSKSIQTNQYTVSQVPHITHPCHVGTFLQAVVGGGSNIKGLF